MDLYSQKRLPGEKRSCIEDADEAGMRKRSIAQKYGK